MTRELELDRPILSAAEILAYEDVIIKIDEAICQELLSRMKRDGYLNFGPELHKIFLNRAKNEYVTDKECDNAVESFYDMWFNYLTVELENSNYSLSLYDTFNIKYKVINDLIKIAEMNIRGMFANSDVNIITVDDLDNLD